MKPFLYSLAFVLCVLFCKAQLGVGYNFVPRLYIEQYKPFRFKHKSDFNYKFNIGLGGDFELHIGSSSADKKVFYFGGPLLGQYYFWNKKIKTIEYPFPYKESNFVSKVGGHFGIGNWSLIHLQRPKGVLWSLSLQGGAAYIENRIIDQNTKAVLGSGKWSHFYSLDISFLIFSKNRLPVLLLGFGYANIDGKHFNGVLF